MVEIPKSFYLVSNETPFPPVNLSLKEPNGLIAVGGELSPERLIDAYSKGIFPWYSDGDPILWYSPEPRMVITPNSLHVANSLIKIIRSNKFEIRYDCNFEAVINECKNIKRINQKGTWIDSNMVDAYTELHNKGFAHSVETYENGKLVGGLYGVAIGKVFFGESMFSITSNASKVALVYLLQELDYQLIDCQIESPHLKSFGAYNVSRHSFTLLLKELL
ncbi:MAG TPA: leucyl/phenylalanyl-tRNA--protein transferase [Gammaproteobacteria bacterium]|nr:leucyl/phenylalanyl-tRNA--protein transferase [Gammaproteobacteria bacterium]